MKIKSVLCGLFMAVVMLPMISSCSGSSDSPFGTLPKVYGEYIAAGEKLEAEAKNIKTEEEKAKYIKKSEKMKEEWSGKIADAAKKLDGKPIEFETGEFTTTQPISFEFKDITQKGSPYVVFNFNGSAEATEDLLLDRNFYAASATVKMVGYDTEGNEVFKTNVGSVACEDKDNRSFIAKGTPIKFEFFQFGGKAAPSYANVKELKFVANN